MSSVYCFAGFDDWHDALSAVTTLPAVVNCVMAANVVAVDVVWNVATGGLLASVAASVMSVFGVNTWYSVLLKATAPIYEEMIMRTRRARQLFALLEFLVKCWFARDLVDVFSAGVAVLFHLHNIGRLHARISRHFAFNAVGSCLGYGGATAASLALLLAVREVKLTHHAPIGRFWKFYFPVVVLVCLSTSARLQTCSVSYHTSFYKSQPCPCNTTCMTRKSAKANRLEHATLSKQRATPRNRPPARRAAGKNSMARVIAARAAIKQQLADDVERARQTEHKHNAAAHYLANVERPKAAGVAALINSTVQAARDVKRRAATAVRHPPAPPRVFDIAAHGRAPAKTLPDVKVANVSLLDPKPDWKLEAGEELLHVNNAPLAIASFFKQQGPRWITRRNVRHQGVYRSVIRIRHTEPVGPLTGQGAYTATQQPVNPNNIGLSPWIAGIAARMDLFLYHSAAICFKTEESASKKGRIGFNFDYEASDAIPPDRVSFEQQQGTKVGPAWENLECEMRAVHATKFFFVSDSNDGGTDVRLTNQALVQWFVADCDDANVTIGELFWRYDLSLMEPTASANNGPLAQQNPAIYLGGLSAANLTGTVLAARMLTAACLVPGSATGYALLASSTATSATVFAFRIYFPYRSAGGSGQILVPVAGSYTVDIDLTANSADTIGVVSTVGSAVAYHYTTWNGITAWAYANAADSPGLYKVTGRFDVSPNPVATTPGPNDTLGPYVDYVFTDVTAGSHFGICAIRICSMGTSAGTGPQVFGTTRDNKFISIRRWLLNAVDGVISFDSQLPAVDVTDRRYFHTIAPDEMTLPLKANLARDDVGDVKHRPLADFKTDGLHYTIKPQDLTAVVSSIDADDWQLLRDLPYAPSCVSPLCKGGNTDTMCYVCLRAAYLRLENVHPSPATAVKGGIGALAVNAPGNRKVSPK